MKKRTFASTLYKITAPWPGYTANQVVLTITTTNKMMFSLLFLRNNAENHFIGSISGW